MTAARLACPRCGTVYLEPVAQCDWCPGERPLPAPAAAAGDIALYRPRRGEAKRVLVHRLTAKRAWVIVPHAVTVGTSKTQSYSARCVSLARLERVRGGLLNAADER